MYAITKHNIEMSNDGRYIGYIEEETVNGHVMYIASIFAQGFDDENTVTTKISTFVKYERLEARRTMIINLRQYNRAN
jgi:hypothetical protein